MLYLELSKSPSGQYFKPLLDPGGGFTAHGARRFHFQRQNGLRLRLCAVNRFGFGSEMVVGL
jgi:hypothetical protein